MRVGLLSREYPPEIYGGAGVHVQHLAAALATLIDVEVHCFGGERSPTPPIGLFAYQPWERLDAGRPQVGPLRAMSVDLRMAAALDGVDVVHSHTWYTNLAGYLASLLYDIPHVMTAHSLEPKRPWKEEQLGTGYRLSSFCERTGIETADAVIAVSRAVALDIGECYPGVDPDRITVIPNAVDTDSFRPDPATDVLDRYGIDPALPIVLCVGRITHQKGIVHLLDAARDIDPTAQLVLRIGPADTPELARDTAGRIGALAAQRDRVVYIDGFVDLRSLVQLLSHATVACCPSIYEPFGLVNIEAMACEAAVVASAVGGIAEIVEHDRTGLLVAFEPASPSDPEPADPARFASDLATAINRLVGDPELARKMGQVGRQRVMQEFSWAAVAARTVALYRVLTS
ncbi:MAG: glycogen synthase [Acidimicrobiales bacterium]